jgi:uncharacterized membrane protein YkvA (DUF1232 family)
MPSSHHAIFRELESLTCGELHSSQRLIQLMLAKVNLLDPAQFAEERCEHIARTFIELLQDVLAQRYQDLSIRAFAHIAVALDYFLDPDESIPDAVPGGFRDDLELLVRTAKRFKREIEVYKTWRRRNTPHA